MKAKVMIFQVGKGEFNAQKMRLLLDNRIGKPVEVRIT